MAKGVSNGHRSLYTMALGKLNGLGCLGLMKYWGLQYMIMKYAEKNGNKQGVRI